MTDNPSRAEIDRRTLLAGAAALPLAGTLFAQATAQAQAQTAEGAFSFAAYGELRGR